MRERTPSLCYKYEAPRKWLLVLSICIFLSISQSVHSAENFTLTPDTVFITSGIGSEFDLPLDIDGAVTGLKLYQVVFAFDKARIDTVSITEGPLMGTSSSPTAPFFDVLLNDDSTTLTIQSVILGNGFSVDGPGNLATIRLRVIGDGVVNFKVLSLAAKGLGNVDLSPFPTASGSIFQVNIPPTSFNLLLPITDDSILTTSTQSIDFDWTESGTIYPGGGVTYTMQYSTDSTFPTLATSEITGVIPSNLSISAASFPDNKYFWRVIAVDDNGFTTFTNQTNSFITSVDVPPAVIDLLQPANDSTIVKDPGETIEFQWESSSTPYPSNPITYTLAYSTSLTFHVDSTITFLGLSTLSQIISVDDLEFNEAYVWRVTAVDSFGFETPSNGIRAFSLVRGSCCLTAGDADHNGTMNIADVTFEISRIFSGGPPPVCADEADANGDNKFNIADVTFLIARIFSGGPPPICGTTGI